MTDQDATTLLGGLNQQQREAVEHGEGPLLVIAGAGSGKTQTLVHRVAQKMHQGIAPGRILLLTFTRRAAAEMLRRVDALLQQLGDSSSRGVTSRAIWGGTFHATASRLLRMHAPAAGLEPDFTILDRSDSEDLMDVVRTELGFSKTHKRFPRKGTCLAIYSHCVSSGRDLQETLDRSFPWCSDYADPLKAIFRDYGERKEQASILDYDDLLLFWNGLLAEPRVGDMLREQFDCVLIDEYQDTNRIQADILRGLCPDGRGLTVVGDDAQAIYSFRAATVRNILDFPSEYPGTTIVKLEQNYRSTQPILAAANGVIEQAKERYTKQLWTQREGGDSPWLVTCHDENDQADFLIGSILERREEGVTLRNQAILYRTSHHSLLLEGELTRRNIPYVKYGGLKFLEAAHIKDLLGFLRLAENPRDVVAGARIFQLLPGIGPKTARQLMDIGIQSGGKLEAWSQATVPSAAKKHWKQFLELMKRLTTPPPLELAAQVECVRRFYEPLLQDRYDNATPRVRDLEQLEQMSSRFGDRQTMLTQITLDPPESTGDLAGPPLLDEDYLILSTIHSAKGLEWDTVYLIHAADGNIPSDMATGNAEEIEEELRLFYVSLTRAKNRLVVTHPLRYYHAARGAFSDKHSYAQLTRFLPPQIKTSFDCRVTNQPAGSEHTTAITAPDASRRIRSKIQSRWT